MHLLAATPGGIDDGSEPFDLGQTPADIVFLSAADTELASLSAAFAEMGGDFTLRLGSLNHMKHPMSVDLHIDNCASKSKLVIIRALGGLGYWQYALEAYAARTPGVALAILPGDDKPDEALFDLSTISRADWEALWAYLVEGGPENARLFLEFADAVLKDGDRPATAKPLLKSGLYWPGIGIADRDQLGGAWRDDAAIVPIIFYRALLEGAGLHPINRLVKALLARGLNPMPVFVASLKDPLSQAVIEDLFTAHKPSLILNATSFAVGDFGSTENGSGAGASNPLARGPAAGVPVFQIILSGSNEEAWAESAAGLSARDIAMNVALPEVDGRVLLRAISFKGESYYDAATQCAIAGYRAVGDRVSFVADWAANWVELQQQDARAKKVGFILANYPNKDGRLANGVGLDTPQATVDMLHVLDAEGYHTRDLPATSKSLMDQIMAGPTNWLADRTETKGGQYLSLARYKERYSEIPYDARAELEARWGQPEDDPYIEGDAFKLSILEYGNLCVGVQPARGYNIDPEETYHSPDLIPPHHYLAFYFWLRDVYGAHALVHMGKHGNLEWLPGKALALSETCWPEIAMGPTPNLYPFIVNDPGEGTQAKRRISATILDHLTPPLTRAEAYGPLRDLEALVDEYYEALGVDPRRLDHLRREILSLTATTGLDKDAGFEGDTDADLQKLDAYLCELKEAQIRDGLHIFGQAPDGALAENLALALARIPRGDGSGKKSSIQRALAADLDLDFDPLDCEMAKAWDLEKPDILQEVSDQSWRSYGDAVERIEMLALALISGDRKATDFPKTKIVLDHIKSDILPMISACGTDERQAMIDGLNGKAIAAGPSGAPTRGRLDVLPTGRNFYSVDSRAIPTPTAWALGWKSANLLIEKHLQTEGDYPRSLLLTAWGTANMRTGGDDIAQALALMGMKPTWDAANRRVTGFEILPLSVLDRPRVDVTLRVSGFFRDAFPQQIDLVDSAARAIQKLDEPDDMNAAAARYREEGDASAHRVFGSKPGAYGAGLQAMIDERLWKDGRERSF